MRNVIIRTTIINYQILNTPTAILLTFIWCCYDQFSSSHKIINIDAQSVLWHRFSKFSVFSRFYALFFYNLPRSIVRASIYYRQIIKYTLWSAVVRGSTLAFGFTGSKSNLSTAYLFSHHSALPQPSASWDHCRIVLTGWFSSLPASCSSLL